MSMSYAERLSELSEAIIQAQRPIRIINSIKWSTDIEEEFKKSGYKDVPKIGPEYYQKTDLGFEPESKKTELKQIIESISLHFGKTDVLGTLLRSIVWEYHDAVEMLESRGTPRFHEFSKKLYGSPKDLLFGDRNTILSLGELLYGILSKVDDKAINVADLKNIESLECVQILTERFNQYFGKDVLTVKLSDGIAADAAAGGDVIKIKENARFSMRDIDILEVHEGWVHSATSLNGRNQKYAKFLSRGTPRCASTQEGLAVMMEIFTFHTYPRRARAINDRILGISKAEDGANMVELFEYYRTEGYSEDECFINTMRVFRGGVPTGGAPFTKDIAYCKGFVENYNFIRTCIRSGKLDMIPFLFSGKLHVDDVPLMYQKYKEGLIDPPHFLPPHFKDLSGLAVWMSFSSFFNLVDLKSVQEHYNQLFEQYSV